MIIVMIVVIISGSFLADYLEKKYGYGALFKVLWLIFLLAVVFFFFKILAPWMAKKFE